MCEPTDELEAVDRLRYQAFMTNSIADISAYHDAASKWFQGEAIRRLERSYVNEKAQREAYDLGFVDGTNRQKERTA